MKYITTILIALLVLTSCGGDKNQSVEDIIASKDLESIEAKRSELKKQQQEIAASLQKIDTALDKLNGKKLLPLITTIPIKEVAFNHFLEIQGSVKTKQNIVLYPEFSGVLKHVYVKEGQQVSKGQTLAKIDDGGLSEQLSQAKTQAALAKTTYERQKRLWDQKIGSEIQFLQAETTFNATQNTVKQLQSQLDKTNVKAPFSGIIDDVITDQGSVVAPGQTPLLRIVNLNNMYIEAEVPESHIPSITKGKMTEVNFPALGKTVKSSIRQVGNFINPNNRAFKIEVGLPNKEGDIKPNLTGKLKINDYTNPEAILIPQSIISENSAGEQYVFVVSGVSENNIGKAKKAIITTGKTQGDFIEVLTGLESGNQVVKEGARSVQDGQEVEISN
ncbi:efflux RND transporter periplasmic adaptor subunit [Seonamhaeicola sediminis]|uniref:Efflux RND transporter periplasmic adaptor subunit n=1 Tax=Seonamhaeicola sediminis TaxID=2528206 RepID=A0A562YCN5_9FLAO|nr:efflux RND transporter periplasmic adaptor subunit [Seonamhaeicola sediminis]TWO32230.1 efflux RND transporter periplasmic adaptor subunit [Seonamhaeicola sediminis]